MGMLTNIFARVANTTAGRFISKALGPVGLAYEAYSGGIVEDWNNGNRGMAILKGAGLGLGVVATTAALIATAPVSAATAATALTVAGVAATASLVVGMVPIVIETVNEELEEVRKEQREQHGSPTPAAHDRVSEQTSPASSPATYAAVDTTRLIEREQPHANQVANVENHAARATPSADHVASADTPRATPSGAPAQASIRPA